MDSITLHAIWSLGRLHLWAEGQAVDRQLTDAPTAAPAVDTPTPHPFALSCEQLRDHTGDVCDSLLIAGADDDSITLRLPTTASLPLHSSEPPVNIADSVKLMPWLVPTLVLEPADAVDLLNSFPDDLPAGFTLADSVRYWIRLADMVTGLLEAQCFVPDIQSPIDGMDRAIWRVVLPAEANSQQLAALISAMPPVCRAVADGGKAPSSVSLIEDFLNATVDAVVRRSLADDPLVQSLQQGEVTARGIEVYWLKALMSEDHAIDAGADERREIARRVSGWIARLDETAGHTRFRTCFRLRSPEDLTDGEITEESPWAVDVYLCAVDDPKVVVTHKRLQSALRGERILFRRQHEELARQMRDDLGKAATAFAPLVRSLHGDLPTGCRINTDEAYQFLREAAPVLELQGFGVSIPEWWSGASRNLGLRLHLQPSAAEHAAVPAFGLDSIVDYDWRIALGDEPLSDEEFDRLTHQQRSLLRIRDQWVEASGESIRRAVRFMESRRRGTATFFEALRMSVADAGVTGLPVIGMDATGWIDAALNGVDTDRQTIRMIAQPASFKGELRPYQAKGMSWMAFLDRYGLGGCLADDMGLGKTIQLIALLLHERQNGATPGPTLLIVPMSLVGNWQRELARFAESLRVMVHHGAERLTGRPFLEMVNRFDVVISTYALTHRDLEHLDLVEWHRIVLDEAQNIKNPSAKQSVAIRSLRSRRRLALTGTPLENHLSELWSILEFLNPGLLGTAGGFRREFAVPIEKQHEEERALQLRRLIRPFVLRRKKSDPAVIVDLPEKMEMKVFCNLSAEQASLYRVIVEEMLGQVELATGIRRRGLVLASLTRLKQVCNHPASALAESPEDAVLAGRSGKCERLVEMLEEVLAESERALVFTQFRSMGELLEKYLRARLGCGILYMHGGTPQKQRTEIVDRFQSGDPGSPVFLLSLKAGGFGLNLTSANHVFHFDRWWNPAVEDQATDRVHRIGQDKTVQVHKFVCVGTIEERIDQMLEEKRDLADRIFGAGEAWLTELSTDDLREVLTLSADAVASG